MKHQYWAVGAMWGGGKDGDAYDEFIRWKCWYSGYSHEEQPAQCELINQICVGDRLAIKKMMGRGATQVMIRAVGIVTDIEEMNMNGKQIKRFHMNWVLPSLNRLVPAKGAFKTIQGPYASDDLWTQQVFQL